MLHIGGSGPPPADAEEPVGSDAGSLYVLDPNRDKGYLLVGPDGRSWGLGAAAPMSSPVRHVTGDRVVAAALTPTGEGCWLATAGGQVLVRGDAPFWGAPADGPVDAPIVDLAVSVSGRGYRLAASSGRVYVFGDAPYHGSHEQLPSTDTIVAVAATADGSGYLLATRHGQVVGFGAVGALATATGIVDSDVDGIVDIAMSPSGGGYWVATAAGAVTAFGDALDAGAPADAGFVRPLVGLVGWRTGVGYWAVDDTGRVFAFGEAPYLGRLPPDAPVGPVAAFAAVPGT